MLLNAAVGKEERVELPINSIKGKADYKSYGGALFLGVKKPVVKAHGSSDDYVFYYTIKQADQFVKRKLSRKNG